jgi:hypothetical protein
VFVPACALDGFRFPLGSGASMRLASISAATEDISSRSSVQVAWAGISSSELSFQSAPSASFPRASAQIRFRFPAAASQGAVRFHFCRQSWFPLMDSSAQIRFSRSISGSQDFSSSGRLAPTDFPS